MRRSSFTSSSERLPLKRACTRLVFDAKSIREDALRINKDSKALIPRASAIILNRTKRERQEVEGGYRLCVYARTVLCERM